MFKRDCLAEKLRRENVEQFNTLVRMHLSFVLDLSTEEDALSEKSKLRKWSFIPFNKKSKICRGIMDGIPLTQEGICQVYQLIEFLKQEPNISTEGIFRRTGSLARQQELKNLLNQGVTVSLENNTYSVHDCASVLKGFLADLPEPLLTEAHYPAHCQIAELCGVCENSAMEAKLLHALQLLLLLLPSENRILLKDVLDLLHYTASYERNNKMSADSLATLFTPHLLCPRNLTPEILHTNSQILSNTVSFMITNSSKLFELPPKLAVDIKAYYTEQERRKLSSRNCNESLSDNFAANTVYSFVDVERTTKENQSNPTETALAQLYAYIQSLPESSKKQKLIKQFNKENGYGTPLQVIRSSVANKNKSVGSSIKKHIFQRSIAKVHKRNATPLRASSEELLNSPFQGVLVRAKLFCNKCDSSSDDENISKKLQTPVLEGKRSNSDPNLSIHKERECSMYVTSTPACVSKRMYSELVFTPEEQGRKSMSPITQSAQRMSKAMQETMMTPRSRKPVLLVSRTNINNLPKITTNECSIDSIEELSDAYVTSNPMRRSKSVDQIKEDTEDGTSLSSSFCKYLEHRATRSPTDSSFTSCAEDYCSAEMSDNKLSSSLLHCLNGYSPPLIVESKELILQPKEFDDDEKPIIYETFF
ncbi:hypothetical protein PPYR_05092 [Photinus pyralis]|uniref:Rho-GAP domain-containing protein n=1 Tax=Photinus pyralis TaxID=7054 RepID=A0A5N4B016_PHOPY|nr:rho GTPase-activating protein 19-like isoform X1 [Photinus pyralis]KAB0802906.1 hypothetical protein PPYR_05092 [Photinus pyralis]